MYVWEWSHPPGYGEPTSSYNGNQLLIASFLGKLLLLFKTASWHGKPLPPVLLFQMGLSYAGHICVSNHRSCEFLCVTTMWWPEDRMSPQSSPSFSSFCPFCDVPWDLMGAGGVLYVDTWRLRVLIVGVFEQLRSSALTAATFPVGSFSGRGWQQHQFMDSSRIGMIGGK